MYLSFIPKLPQMPMGTENTVKSRLSERQLSETTGCFEDDGRLRLFSLVSIAIKLLFFLISIF